MQPTVAVVGGGMAGLGAALAVARARPDAEVLLLEQAPAFAEVGAGIQLGPNATRVLRAYVLLPNGESANRFAFRLTAQDEQRELGDAVQAGGKTVSELEALIAGIIDGSIEVTSPASPGQ